MSKAHHQEPLDLIKIARETMLENGFEPDFPASARNEVEQEQKQQIEPPKNVRDLRSLLWSSVDNVTSRDLDQVEFIEPIDDDRLKVMVGIADVDSFVKKDSALDEHARHNTTSVYTGVTIFPMLPEELSTDKTSLLNDQDRLAIVIEFEVVRDGTTTETEVYPALIHNHAKLDYESVGRWLDDNGPIPPAIPQVRGLEEQIRLQSSVANRLAEVRRRQGALQLNTIQTSFITDEKGNLVDFTTDEPNSAREIIENFMVAANVAMADFLDQQKIPSLRRVVRTPENWPRIKELAAELGADLPDEPDARALHDFLQVRKQSDPVRFPDLSLAIVKLLGPGEYVVQRPGTQGEGHFGLALHNYTHSTAPNRRYADLITQRLLKANLASSPSPYQVEELESIAERCTERESAARKVERKMRKVASAQLLLNRIGEEFEAIVTGITPKGTFARTLRPPVDGLIVSGKEHLKVGQRIEVRLTDVDPARGFIDFAVLGDSRTH